MRDKAVYYVGKPYPFLEADRLIRGLGFKVGLLIDKNVHLRNPERFDTVVSLDFSSSSALLQDIADKDLMAAGLICTYENYIVAKSELSKHLGLPSIEPKQAALCTDKYLMRQAFMKSDPSITPRFGVASTKAELLELANTLTYPLIIKPTNLVKSLLVLRCNDQAELEHNFEYAQANIGKLYEKYRIYDRSPQLIIEEYVIGKMYTVAAFVDKDGTAHFCEGITELTTAQDIGKSDNYLYSRRLPAILDDGLQEQLLETARRGVAALGMKSSPAHIELICGPSGPKIVEIGARIGGYRPRMYELGYGMELIKAEIQLALGLAPELKGTFKNYSAVYELFSDKEGSFQTIEGDVDTSKFVSYNIKLKPGQQTGPAKNGYKAAAVVVLSSPDRDEFDSLCSSVDRLKVVVE